MHGGIRAVPLLWALAALPGRAQVGLTAGMANGAYHGPPPLQTPSSDYTFKEGDFSMLVVSSLNLQWNDNVYLSQTNSQDDFIILPTVGATMSYPLTDRNLLQFNVTSGYSKYVNHDDLSSWYLQSGSGLSLDLYVKDVRINLHDQFSYQQDSAQNSAVANTGIYGSFNNTSGVSADWHVNDWEFSSGYDHQIELSTAGQFGYTDHSSELGYLRAGYSLTTTLTAGLEGSASYVAYDQTVLNNNESYSAGAYVDWKPDEYVDVRPRAGYTIFQFDNTSSSLKTSELNTWYAGLNVSHQLLSWMSYSIDAGRQVNLGIQSDINEDLYIRPSITWQITGGFSVRTSFFYDHGKQGVGSTKLAANSNLVSESYDWYGGELSFSHAITSRFSMSLNYRLTERSSTAGNRGYTQNLVGIQLNYRPL